MLNHWTRQWLQVGHLLATAGFLQFLINIDLIFVSRKEHSRREASPIFQLEKASAVERNARPFVVEVWICKPRVGYIVGGILVVGSLRRGFAQNLGILFQ